jgi:predicted SAM-dependent methyltransferase
VITPERKVKVLHFAPEKIITKLFTSFKNVDYLSADIDPSKAMVKEDITKVSFPDNSFDIIFCSHVLEHIPDDRLAMRELYRILKPQGFAILQVPIKDVFNNRIIDKTYEDFSIVTPEGREKAFGQHDHVRVYGRDFRDRISSVGFRVKEEKFINSIPAELVQRYALLPSVNKVMETEGWIYHCAK